MDTIPLSSIITITPAATAKLRSLIVARGNENLKLRLYIVGGGCSGFQYGFGLDEKIHEDDIVMTQDAVAIVVDALSAPYLQNSVIDYTEDLQGAKFIVNNPNADTTCGCGSSFSLKEGSEAA